MHANTFWKLHKLMHKDMKYHLKPQSLSKKKWKNGAKNGLIHSATRLSCAIRYFAGGSPYDIAIAHDISTVQVLVSVWRVVDAVNNNSHFDICFPSHAEQEEVSNGFKQKSSAGFDGCVGCINGMLLWMEKPSNHNVKFRVLVRRSFSVVERKSLV